MNALLRRFRRPAPFRTVTLYTRAGCHLCDDAEKPVARAVAGTPGTTLRIVDIAGDANLEAQYGLRIPVVTLINAGADVEQIVAEGKISDIRLRRAFDARVAGG